MTIYCKEVLRKVSFDLTLFEKEFIKALDSIPVEKHEDLFLFAQKLANQNPELLNVVNHLKK